MMQQAFPPSNHQGGMGGPPAPISPLPHYPSAGDSQLSNPPSPVATHETSATSTGGSNSPGSSLHYSRRQIRTHSNNGSSSSSGLASTANLPTSPLSPYNCQNSVASSNLTTSPYYSYNYNNQNLDSPYSVHSYDSSLNSASTAKITAPLSSPGASSSSQYSAYDGDNESHTIMSGTSTSNRPPSELDIEFERRSSHTGPNARAIAMLEQTVSAPGGGICRNGSKLLYRKRDLKRERAANMRALSLMDIAAAGQEQKSKVANDGSNEIHHFKSEDEISRQAKAQCRALHLLKTTAITSGSGNQNKMDTTNEAMSVDTSEDGRGGSYTEGRNQWMDISEDQGISANKINRQRYAQSRAANLPAGSLTDDDLDDMDYRKRHNQKTSRAPTRVSVHSSRPEALAESTRRRAKTAEDVRDPETVAGMKCQLDIEREQWARAKALRLLNRGYIS